MAVSERYTTMQQALFMKLKIILLLVATHLSIGAAGFSLGIYVLPILVAPHGPSESVVSAMTNRATYSGVFSKDRKDSDTLHWGEGQLAIGTDFIALMGELSPGPDYKLYLAKEFVETETEFNRLKSTMVRVGDIRTFDNFILKLSPEIDPAQYNTAIVWCETFGQFITSAQYQ